jgi:cbb3-type cytochrome oxidase subunit 3
MKQEVLSHFNHTWLPLTALLLFIACFTLYLFWTFKKENKKLYEEISHLPLKDKELP